MISEQEKVQALLNQALAQARSKGTDRITELHFVMYGWSQEAEENLRELLQELSAHTPADNAEVYVRAGPQRFICWNCCGLRFESDEEEAICPNCGHTALSIPDDIGFALERIEVSPE